MLFEQTEEEIQNYFTLNSDCGVSKTTIWDAFKAVIRGHFISVASARRKAKENIVSDIKAKITFLEAKHVRYGGKKYLRKLELERKRLALYETSQAQHNLLFLKQKYTSRSPYFLKRLSWKASKTLSSKFINRLRDNANRSVTSSASILAEFQKFYEQLYSTSGPNVHAIETYLKSNFKINLSSDHRDAMEEPITSVEVLAAIQGLKSCKSPGRDGLPAEFYKRFKHLLADHITDLCNTLMCQGDMPRSWKEACIVVLPKKDKDPTNVTSYCPIS